MKNKVNVIRNDEMIVVAQDEIVPGDLIEVSAGILFQQMHALFRQRIY